METVFASLSGERLIGSHPVYPYLTRRYALNLKSVHWEPDAIPDETMVRELDDLLEAHAAKIMIREGEPLKAIQLMTEKKGLKNSVFNPCGNRPTHGDYLSVMKENILNIEMR